MELEIGVVCGRCDAYAIIGTASCTLCGAALALETVGSGAPESLDMPATEVAPREATPPPSSGVASEPPTLIAAPKHMSVAPSAPPPPQMAGDATQVDPVEAVGADADHGEDADEHDAPPTDRTPMLDPFSLSGPSAPPAGMMSLGAKRSSAPVPRVDSVPPSIADETPFARGTRGTPNTGTSKPGTPNTTAAPRPGQLRRATNEFEKPGVAQASAQRSAAARDNAVDSLGAVLNASLKPRPVRTPFPILEARESATARDPREEPNSQPAALQKKPSHGAVKRPSLEELMDQAKNFVCKSCSTPVPMGHKFCGRCGASVPAEILATRTQFFGQLQTPGRAKLILIRGDGVEGLSYQLNAENHLVGRQGQLVFPDDPFVSPKHANLFYREGKLVVRDEGSLNGVYVRVRGTIEIGAGDVFLAGEQVFRLEGPAKPSDAQAPDGTYFYSSPKHPSPFRILQQLQGGPTGMTVCARPTGLQIGREGGDLNFPTDLYMSASHCRIEESNGKYQLTDLNSRNGTFVKLHAERVLEHGDYLFIGKKLLRVEITAA
jgi:pSer/pThr/pTyr-binding forkhead associated (FHA) protein